MKAWSGWRLWTGMLLGGYLFSSPLLLGTPEEPTDSRNATVVGVWIMAVALWALIIPGSRAAEWTKVLLAGWLLIAPFVLGFTDLVKAWNAWIVGVLLIASVGIMRIRSAFVTLLRESSLRYWARKLSPERIVGYRDAEESVSAERLCRHIVERSDRIYATLLDTPSEVEVEMCTLGYRTCAGDMIMLACLVNEELPKSGSIRRIRLRVAYRRAAASVSRVRKVLPADALHVPHQERP
jgi:hypothetical protein